MSLVAPSHLNSLKLMYIFCRCPPQAPHLNPHKLITNTSNWSANLANYSLQPVRLLVTKLGLLVVQALMWGTLSEKQTLTRILLIFSFFHLFVFFSSYLHRYIKMRFLTCEPNLNHDADYVDEAEQFFREPIGWLNAEYSQLAAYKQPTHIAYYSNLHETLLPYLNKHNYSKCAQFFYTHFPEGRVGADIFVSCKI